MNNDILKTNCSKMFLQKVRDLILIILCHLSKETRMTDMTKVKRGLES